MLFVRRHFGPLLILLLLAALSLLAGCLIAPPQTAAWAQAATAPRGEPR